jgi:adenylate cyclase
MAASAEVATAELLVTEGVRAGTVYFLGEERVVIGRSEGCDVVIPDPWISGRHAAVERRGDELWLVDLDSRNGTFVEGRPIREARLEADARIAFGHTLATLRAVGRAPGVPQQAAAVRYLADAEQLVAQGAAATDPARRQLAALQAVARALVDAADLDESLGRILATVAAAVGAERSSLLLLDAHGALVPRVHLPPDAPPRLSASVVAAAARGRAGFLVTDARHDARFAAAQSVVMHGIRSCLCVPIWAEGRTLGMLVLDRGLVKPFTADDLDLVTAVAYQAALAIERARLQDHARTVDQQRRRLLRHFSPDVANLILSQKGLKEDPLSATVREEATMLFSDVRGFTGLTERLPPLELAQLLREYLSEMTKALFEERGTLDKFMGDGLMAVFGVPVAAKDDAVRAVRCATLMRARLAGLNARLPEDRRLAIRIGINTGRVVAGSFGTPERLEFTVLGDAVNVAARLESIAEPGAICVGEATFERTRDHFAYRLLGERAVKGRTAPVRVYELVER